MNLGMSVFECPKKEEELDNVLFSAPEHISISSQAAVSLLRYCDSVLNFSNIQRLMAAKHGCLSGCFHLCAFSS
jgi:hypothetical protein